MQQLDCVRVGGVLSVHDEDDGRGAGEELLLGELAPIDDGAFCARREARAPKTSSTCHALRQVSGLASHLPWGSLQGSPRSPAWPRSCTPAASPQGQEPRGPSQWQSERESHEVTSCGTQRVGSKSSQTCGWPRRAWRPWCSALGRGGTCSPTHLCAPTSRTVLTFFGFPGSDACWRLESAPKRSAPLQ